MSLRNENGIEILSLPRPIILNIYSVSMQNQPCLTIERTLRASIATHTALPQLDRVIGGAIYFPNKIQRIRALACIIFLYVKIFLLHFINSVRTNQQPFNRGARLSPPCPSKYR